MPCAWYKPGGGAVGGAVCYFIMGGHQRAVGGATHPDAKVARRLESSFVHGCHYSGEWNYSRSCFKTDAVTVEQGQVYLQESTHKGVN